MTPSYKFLKILAATLGHEGSWSDHPLDKGGPTYRGITLKYHGKWPGWAVIEELRGNVDFPLNLDSHTPLQTLVEEFYRQKYWKPLRGDDISHAGVAGELFDTAINLGKSRAVRILQRCLNALNYPDLYGDLTVDGHIGSVTVAAVNTYAAISAQGSALLAYMNAEQGHHYVEQGLKTRSQRAFTKGWAKRLGTS